MKKHLLAVLIGLFLFSSLSHALIVLNEAKSGKTIAIKRNEIIVIRLNSNPTTGFDWYLDNLDQKSFKLLEDKYFPAKTNLVGSGGIKEFKLKALQKGNKSIKLLYYRVWEGKKTAVNKANFKLCVK